MVGPPAGRSQGHTGEVTGEFTVPAGVDPDDVIERLRSAGARFAFVFGSRSGAGGPSHPVSDESDLDVGAWWGHEPPDAWRVALPAAVDLVVLDRAPLFLAGRVAMWGVLLFEDDAAARVHWQADTRKRYLDEKPRWERADADFAAAVTGG